MFNTTPTEKPWQRQQLRVPREDGALFARPELPDVPPAVERNAERLTHNSVNVQGRGLPHLREWAQRKAFEAAVEYTTFLTGESPAESPAAGDCGFIVDGHQPSLFHPGVWVKNFAIHHVARQTGRRSLHLVVDNDTISSSSIRIPAGDRQAPRFESIPFDSARPTAPWEDARVEDAGLFRSFGDRTTAAMRNWGVDPLIADIWSDAVELFERGAALRDCFTAARRRLEGGWGVDNLELPLGRLCRTDPFLWFASHLFAQAPRFREIHNETLRQYRQVNRVRSRTHPVPELAAAGDWTETPFWIWNEGDAVRRRAFVRRVGPKEMELTDRADFAVRFPLSPDMDACCSVEVLRELPAQGVRLRTRALSTTLFARLCLADLFVHGIGGAKYDEMTDRIIARFFGVAPPEFLTLSGTRRLPIAEPFDAGEEDERSLRRRLRDLQYNSDRVLSEGNPAESVAELIAEKRRLVARQREEQSRTGPRRVRRQRTAENHRRFARLQEIARQLSAFTEEEQRNLHRELESVQSRRAANAVLQNREFAFCLYPESTLRPFLTQWS